MEPRKSRERFVRISCANTGHSIASLTVAAAPFCYHLLGEFAGRSVSIYRGNFRVFFVR